MEKMIINPFLPRKDGFKAKDIKFEEDYDDIEIKEVVKKIGDGEEDFVVVPKIIHKKRNISAYINSFAQDVGIYNILEKTIAAGGTVDDVIKTTADNAGAFIDVSNVPSNLREALDIVKAGYKAFDNLPDDVKNKLNIDEFVKTFTDDKFNEYIQTKIQGQIKEKEIKEDKKDDKKEGEE